MPVCAFENHRPTIAATTYIAPSAQIIGKVTIGERCYIGHGAILRGDFGSIEIGDETAIEEGVIVHSRPEERTLIGARVTVGHGAMVHNATVEDGAVIGMRAVISDYAEVGAGSIVGEMGLVKNHQKIPSGKVAVGVPVRIVGDIDERHHMMTHTAKTLYVELARRYAEGAMVEIAPPWPGSWSNRDE
jgi:carbonic anhydrase/acetyltransferase-like protein (isoleucine patch superfamily)